MSISFAAAGERSQFFAPKGMYYARISNWDPNKMSVQSMDLGGLGGKDAKVSGAVFEMFTISGDAEPHCPDSAVKGQTPVVKLADFELSLSGNKTRGTPKSSYKVKPPKNDRVLGMTALNLKSMWNDVSQMREALIWKMFDKMGVPAPKHAYARFCINGRYYGLYSLIENIDASFAKDRFAQKGGNLYKANWPDEDLGPATLAYRPDEKYFVSASKERTYELRTNEDEVTEYRDLAALIRAIDKLSDQTTSEFEKLFDVERFVKWAALNSLLGAWDNYWKTPSNYYLYNGGQSGTKDRMSEPYFAWIPWDYDNSFGISYDGIAWQDANILDWEAGLKEKLPLIRKVLRVKKYREQYVAELKRAMDKFFNEQWIQSEMDKTWALISKSAFMESDTPKGQPHTGRQFTNDEVYQHGVAHNELHKGGMKAYGIFHYVKMRRSSVEKQIRAL